MLTNDSNASYKTLGNPGCWNHLLVLLIVCHVGLVLELVQA